MDWFERLTGFRETNYADTRAKLRVEGGRLHSTVNSQSYLTGELTLVSLKELRDRLAISRIEPRESKVAVVTGDVRKMHQAAEYAGATFQVASQFNLLEMVSPHVTPEQGVTRYQNDHTQGPACAMAAGAATIYRNYFAPVGGEIGQTAKRQLDGLADLGITLARALNRPVSDLWEMRNGYTLCTAPGLDAIGKYLSILQPDQLDLLRGELRIGLHQDIEVTDLEHRPLVTQAFCSALPVAYTSVPRKHWSSFGQFVLEAAYEATVTAAALNAKRGVSNIVLLTQLGGGAFGNDDGWIHAAMRRAFKIASGLGIDIRIVSYGQPPSELLRMSTNARTNPH
jgi:hypothetical protein